MARQLNKRVVTLAVLAVIIIIALLVAVIVLASKGDKDESPGPQPDKQQRSGVNLLENYGIHDGLDLKWQSGVIDETHLSKITEGKIHIIETDVFYIDGTFYTSRDREVTLKKLIDKLKSSETGLKIDLETSENFNTQADKLLRELHESGFTNCIIFTLPVFLERIDIPRILSTKTLPKNFLFNFDLTSECCATSVGRGSVEYVYNIQRLLNAPSLVEASVDNLIESWKDLKWLISKNVDTRLVISGMFLSNDSLFDMLTVRNDIDPDRVVYIMNESALKAFRHVASTAGSPLIYFDIIPRDAGKIVWSHNTDTWEQLNDATRGDVMMVEGDIMLLGQDTPDQTQLPIMAHDVGDYNNLTFEQWLDEIIKFDRGMKFDFKSLDAVRPALHIVKQKRGQIKGPIWLNADILKGPKGKETRIPADEFLKAIEDFPEATLSLGWTTVAKGDDLDLNYTMEMMTEMHYVCKTLVQPITFPVRAEQLVKSWDNFHWLLQQSRGYTLTVWTSLSDSVTKGNMDFIKKQAELSRIYFDLPENWRPSFR